MSFRQPIVAFGVGEDGNLYPPKGEVAAQTCGVWNWFSTTPRLKQANLGRGMKEEVHTQLGRTRRRNNVGVALPRDVARLTTVGTCVR
jgi:hypothetical protein